MAGDPIGGAIRNLIDLQRLGNGLSVEVNALIGRLFDDIAAEIARIDPTSPDRRRYRTERLEKLVGSIDALIGKGFSEIRATLVSRWAEIGVQQARWAERNLEQTLGAVGVDITSGRVGLGMMRSIIQSDPFEGAPLVDWVKGIEGSLTHKRLGAVRRQLQAGMAGNETLDQLIRRIRGRSNGRGGFTGGVLQTTTRQAEAIARTGVNFIANRGHLATYQENADILKGLEFTATLDNRTTEICMALDGTILDAEKPDQNKVPPRHWRCRSILTPIVDWEGLGIEPPPEGMRASADGPVPSSTKYEDWLRGRPPGEQDEILGPTRAQLFRDGKLDLKALITRDQQVVTVKELEAKLKDAGGPVSRQKFASIVTAEEDAIRGAPIEHATAFNPTTGEVVLRKTTGQRSRVSFTPAELALMPDTVLTHNHPSSSSFSPADVAFMIVNDLAEIRAVGTRYSYRLIRPDGGWEPLTDVRLRQRRAEDPVWEDLMVRVARGEISRAEASVQFYHEVWSRVFRGTPVRYIRRER